MMGCVSRGFMICVSSVCRIRVSSLIERMNGLLVGGKKAGG